MIRILIYIILSPFLVAVPGDMSPAWASYNSSAYSSCCRHNSTLVLVSYRASLFCGLLFSLSCMPIWPNVFFEFVVQVQVIA